jgi:hypothetical protein
VPRARAYLAAALLAVTVAASGCQDDPSPIIVAPSPTPTVSTSPTPEPEPTATPTLPASTPVKATESWFAAWTIALRTGDTTEVRLLSTEACASCNRLIGKVEEVYSKGASYKTRGWFILTDVAAPNSTPQRPIRLLRIVETPRRLIDADGEVVDASRRTELPMRITLERVGTSYRVHRIEVLS